MNSPATSSTFHQGLRVRALTTPDDTGPRHRTTLGRTDSCKNRYLEVCSTTKQWWTWCCRLKSFVKRWWFGKETIKTMMAGSLGMPFETKASVSWVVSARDGGWFSFCDVPVPVGAHVPRSCPRINGLFQGKISKRNSHAEITLRRRPSMGVFPPCWPPPRASLGRIEQRSVPLGELEPQATTGSFGPLPPNPCAAAAAELGAVAEVLGASLAARRRQGEGHGTLAG